MRHYVGVSKRNYDLDSGFYPLGSCTMKHNPAAPRASRSAARPQPAAPAPGPEQDAQGALELMWNLQEALAEISGLPHVSLQPAAGSHGELAGLLLMRAYHEARGEHRTKVLMPDTAHGTNPATVTMAGMEVVKVATDARGDVDIDDLRAKADSDVACLMLTNPNTLGLFDPNIEEIARDLPRRRRDALLRRREPQRGDGDLAPGRHGLRHRPLQPAQVVHPAARRRRPRRRPGRGLRPRRAVPARPVVAREDDGGFLLDDERPQSIGRLRGFQGNFGSSCAPTRTSARWAPTGCCDASETAVLNANYLLARLREHGVAEYLPLAYGELCMHEFVLSGGPMKRELQIKTLDLAKRLLDYGYPPADRLLPAAGRRGADDRADRDRDEGDARRLRGRRRGDPRRGGRGRGGRSGGALQHAGAASGRGGRSEAARDQTGFLAMAIAGSR